MSEFTFFFLFLVIVVAPMVALIAGLNDISTTTDGTYELVPEIYDSDYVILAQAASDYTYVQYKTSNGRIVRKEVRTNNITCEIDPSASAAVVVATDHTYHIVSPKPVKIVSRYCGTQGVVRAWDITPMQRSDVTDTIDVQDITPMQRSDVTDTIDVIPESIMEAIETY